MTSTCHRSRLALPLLLLALLPWRAAAQPLRATTPQPPILAAGLTEVPEPAASTSGSPAAGLSLDLPPLVRLTGLPPQAGSVALHDDLAILHWLQANRTPQMVAATWMTLGRDPAVFSSALGVDMSKTTPTLASNLLTFLALVDKACDQIKKQVQRQRPYLSHSDLKPCLPPEIGFSFPSGHSSWYTAASRLLADLVPERRDRLEEMGKHGAANRVMCGVHYPSDVLAAQRFGRAAADQIIASPQWQRFRRDPVIQAEVQRVLQIRPEVLPQLLH